MGGRQEKENRSVGIPFGSLRSGCSVYCLLRIFLGDGRNQLYAGSSRISGTDCFSCIREKRLQAFFLLVSSGTFLYAAGAFCHKYGDPYGICFLYDRCQRVFSAYLQGCEGTGQNPVAVRSYGGTVRSAVPGMYLAENGICMGR